MVSTLLYQILLVLFITILITYLYFRRVYTYWQRRKTPFLPPTLLLGNVNNPFTNLQSIAVQFAALYRQIKRKRLGNVGCYFFTKPIYILTDLDHIKNVLVKDFNYFEHRGIYYNPNQNISPHLIAIEGDGKWRNIRTKLSPLFTNIKLKQIYDILLNSSKDLVDAIGRSLQISRVIDLRDMMNSYTIDNIASSAFGLETKSFTSVQNDFKKYGTQAMQPDKKQNLIDLFCLVAPQLSRKLNLKPFSNEVNDFFTNIVTETVSYREKNNVQRADFLQQMIEMKNDTDLEKRLTIESIIAQCFVFFVAGYDTSSSTLTFTLLEMSENPEVQERAREEVIEVASRYGGQLTYEAISEMIYLGQVIDENLRKHPPAGVNFRMCTKEYNIPNTDIVLEKGMLVIIPILGIQNDTDIFPEPETFDPDRFSDQNKRNIHTGSYIPFGDGPRICLGLRFAMLQVKLGLAAILLKYRFTPHPKTRLPVKLKPSLLLAIDGDVLINVEKI